MFSPVFAPANCDRSDPAYTRACLDRVKTTVLRVRSQCSLAARKLRLLPAFRLGH